MRVLQLIADAAPGARLVPYRLAQAVWRGARLYRALDAASRLPGIGPAFTRARLRVKLWAGDDALVPEHELRLAYTTALTDLVERRGVEGVGDYVEFGVYTGTSLACMHDASASVGATGMRLFGFDSFEGLPEGAAEDDDRQWKPGSWRSDLDLTRAALTRRGVDWNRVELVAGWFDDTLTPATAERLGLKRVSVVMVDCDTYSAAKSALTFCEALIRDEAIVFFDDWNTRGLADKDLGEKRAFDELLADHPELQATSLEAYAPTAAAFRVTRRSAA